MRKDRGILNIRVDWIVMYAARSSWYRIPKKRVGGLLRFDLSEVMAWLNRREEAEVSCGK
jgi:hypothetical protein